MVVDRRVQQVWTVHNFPLISCGKPRTAPWIVAPGLSNTKWQLGAVALDADNVAFILRRHGSDAGPLKVNAHCRLFVRLPDGTSPLFFADECREFAQGDEFPTMAIRTTVLRDYLQDGLVLTVRSTLTKRPPRIVSIASCSLVSEIYAEFETNIYCYEEFAPPLFDYDAPYHSPPNRRLDSDDVSDTDSDAGSAFDTIYYVAKFQSHALDERGVKISFINYGGVTDKFINASVSLLEPGRRRKCGTVQGSRLVHAGNVKEKLVFPFFIRRSDLLEQSGRKFLPDNTLCLHVDDSLTRDDAISSAEVLKLVFRRHSAQTSDGCTSTLGCRLQRASCIGSTSDVLLRCDGSAFHAHGAVLAARSAVFRKMLASGMSECRSGQVDSEDVHPDTLRRLVSFLYSEAVDEDDAGWKDIAELYYAADKYVIPSLRRRCFTVLVTMLDAGNVVQTLEFARRFEDAALVEACEKFVAKVEECDVSLPEGADDPQVLLPS